MSYALVAHTIGAPTTRNGITTPSIDTTGADLIVIGVGSYQTAPTLTDSKGNVWTALTKSASNAVSQIYYCQSPTVGAGHTFTVTGTNTYSNLSVAAFSGSVASPFDVLSVANSTGTTVNPGSITPSADNELVFFIGCSQTGTAESFSVGTLDSLASGSSVNVGIADGYVIQTTAAAINPTFTATSNGTFPLSASIASFKAASGGTSVSLTDSGSGSESIVIAMTGSLSDSGGGSETLGIAVTASVTDSGAGAESLLIATTLSVTDSGSGADIVSILANAAVTDSGSGVDSVSPPSATVTVTDILVGAESLTIIATMALTDSGSGADLVSVDTGTIINIIKLASIAISSPQLTGAAINSPVLKNAAISSPNLTNITLIH